MRVTAAVTAAIAVSIAGVLPVVAQDQQPGLVAEAHMVLVKPDQTLQFEAAFRQHLELHDSNEDSWAWYTWQVVIGDRLGQYLIRSHGHTWLELDQRAAARRLDEADFVANVAPHTTEMSSALEVFEAAVSNWPEEAGRPEMVELTRFWLNFDGSSEFLHVVQKVHGAVVAADPSVRFGWLTTVTGSKGPLMTLVVPINSWADFGARKKSVWDIVESQYGEHEAQLLRAELGRSIRAEESLVLRYRADLSYEPGP